MLLYLRPKFLSKINNFVNVRFHSGTTTEGNVDFLKLFIRRKPDTVIIQAGTDDLTNDTNIIKQIPIGFSVIIKRVERSFKDQTKDSGWKGIVRVMVSLMWITKILMRNV